MDKSVRLIRKIFIDLTFILLIAFYVSANESREYYVDPDFPDSAWIASSIILATLGGFGIISNVIIVAIYMKKTAV